MPTLANLGPREQLRAGRLGRRIPQLFVGLVVFGVSLGLMIRAQLGNSPWDVLHQGMARHLPLSVGAASIIVSVVVLAMWFPLKEMPGVGTVFNALVVGLVTDATMRVCPAIEGFAWQIVVAVVGIVLNGLAGAMYIGAQLGPGPRDGLMTGLHRVTGRSILMVRTLIEVTVVVVGFLLGGRLGLATVVYALAIGPIVHWLLPRFVVELPGPGSVPRD